MQPPAAPALPRTITRPRALPRPQLPPGVERVLGGEEVAALVALLREKWGAVHAAYQRLPCVVDTPSKRRRKEVRARCSRATAGWQSPWQLLGGGSCLDS